MSNPVVGRRMLALLGSAALVFGVASPRLALAKKAAAAEKKPSTALVVLGTGEGAKPLVAAVEEFFTQAMRFYPEYKILHGDAGAKKLKKAAQKCKAQVPCLARVGKRSKATEVLLANVVAGDGGAQGPGDEGDRHFPERALSHLLDVGHFAIEEIEAEDRCGSHHRQRGDGAVLAGQEGLGAFPYGIRDLSHLGSAGVRS